MTKWQKYRKIQNGESTGVRVCPCKYVEYIWRCLGTAKKWQKNPLWSSNYRTTYTNYRMMTTFGVSSKCRIATKKKKSRSQIFTKRSRQLRSADSRGVPERISESQGCRLAWSKSSRFNQLAAASLLLFGFPHSLDTWAPDPNLTRYVPHVTFSPVGKFELRRPQVWMVTFPGALFVCLIIALCLLWRDVWSLRSWTPTRWPVQWKTRMNWHVRLFGWIPVASFAFNGSAMKLPLATEC